MKILLVEDHRMDVELALETFRQLSIVEGVQVAEMGRGRSYE